MDDSARRRRGQRAGAILSEFQKPRQLRLPAQSIPKARSFDEFLYQKPLAVVLEDIVDRHDGGMSQRRRGPSLAQKVIPASAVVGEAGDEAFQSDPAAERGVPGFVHLPRAPKAQELSDLVAPDGPPRELCRPIGSG